MTRAGWMMCAATLTGCAASAAPAGPSKASPTNWFCPWPEEGVAKGVQKATVVLRVLVGKDGKPRDIRIEKDPGYGFGAAARGCAMRATYFAKDAEGRPMEAWSPPLKIHFAR